jgi:hypothetical protein
MGPEMILGRVGAGTGAGGYGRLACASVPRSVEVQQT